MTEKRKGSANKGHIALLRDGRTWYAWHTAQLSVRFSGRTSFEVLGKLLTYHTDKGKLVLPKGTRICPVDDDSELVLPHTEEPGTRPRKPSGEAELGHTAGLAPPDDAPPHYEESYTEPAGV